MREVVERAAQEIMPDAWKYVVRPDGKKYWLLVCAEDEQWKARSYAEKAINATR